MLQVLRVEKYRAGLVRWWLQMTCFLLSMSFAAVSVLADNLTEIYLQTMYSRVWSNCVDNLSKNGFLPEDEQYRKQVNYYTASIREQIHDYVEITHQGMPEIIQEMLMLEHDFPLYKCSGLIIRGTRQNRADNQGAWEPYPAGRVSDTSFSYLRADIKMKRLAWSYTNGFIIDPPKDLKINCFYPLDASSDQRSERGCGAHERAPSFDPECEFDAVMTDKVPVEKRCRYDLRVSYVVTEFERGVAAAVKASQVSEIPNDLKIETWNKGYDPRLKIRAFFYLNAEGKPFAQRDRDAYEALSKIHVPLVEMTFPASSGGNVTFKVVD